MSRIALLIAVAVGLAIAASALGDPADAPDRRVLVELFTSQG